MSAAAGLLLQGADAGVYVVLATHNGAAFLEQQIDSILAQGPGSLQLLAMDDRSDDSSPAILDRYARRDPRVRRLERPPDLPHGALASYGHLLQAALGQGARYVFCADQDDIWLPGKMELLLAALSEAEGAEGNAALVHHDLEVVDRDLGRIAASFWSRMGLAPGTEERPQRLLSRNEVTGCALACNRALLEQALPIPPQAIMHDWWLALCAAFLGHVRPLDRRLVRYRQHGGNAIGAKSWWHGLNPFTSWRQGWRRGNAEFLETIAQARAFRDAVGGRLDANGDAYRALISYCGIPALSRRQRVRLMRECGLTRDQWLLNTVLKARLWLLPGGDG